MSRVLIRILVDSKISCIKGFLSADERNPVSRVVLSRVLIRVLVACKKSSRRHVGADTCVSRHQQKGLLVANVSSLSLVLSPETSSVPAQVLFEDVERNMYQARAMARYP